MIKPQNPRVTILVLKFLIEFSTLEDKILEMKLLDTTYVERIATVLFESNINLVKVKAAFILSNLVASSNLFISKFI